MVNERKDLDPSTFTYEDDFIHIWIEKIENNVACPHFNLKKEFTPMNYKRLLICAESYCQLLKEQGIVALAAVVPEESKRIVGALGFDLREIPGTGIKNVMIREL